jgi:glutamate racemase
VNNNPIGLFDSGMGGLSVWRVLQKSLANESLIFYGDGARCPYGTRSAEEIRRFTVEAVEQLLGRGCKLIVIACNTATAVAIESLREQFPETPFVGLEPAVKPAALTTQTGRVAVLATRRSLEGELFRRTSARYGAEVEILPVEGEGFVEIVEQSRENSPEAEVAVRRVVEPLLSVGVDKIVLGCTHYPFLRPVIERVVEGRGVDIIDSSEAIERRVEQLLDMYDLRAEATNEPFYDFMTAADDIYAERLRKKALG